MSEFSHNGKKYRIGRLDARKQFHLYRRLMPVQSALAQAALEATQRLADAAQRAASAPTHQDAADMLSMASAQTEGVQSYIGPLSAVVSQMAEPDVDYILDVCLAVVQRESDGRWGPVLAGGQSGALMYHDITMGDMMVLTIEVIRENLGSFFGMLPGSNVS